MPDLPPDVRDRAAQAAREAVIVGKPWRLVPESEKAELFVMVDAVAEVLADHWAPSAFAFLDQTDVEVDRDTLKARVENLLAHNAEHRAQVDDLQEWNERLETERDALKARVDLLTTALTDLVDIVDAASYLTALSNGDHDRVERARAALSVTPTKEAP